MNLKINKSMTMNIYMIVTFLLLLMFSWVFINLNYISTELIDSTKMATDNSLIFSIAIIFMPYLIIETFFYKYARLLDNKVLDYLKGQNKYSQICLYTYMLILSAISIYFLVL